MLGFNGTRSIFQAPAARFAAICAQPYVLVSKMHFSGSPPAQGQARTQYFDRQLKRTQRNNAAQWKDSAQYDYLRSEVTRRLVDRIEDISREFEVCADIGAGSGFVKRHLGDKGRKLKSLIHLELAEKSLLRDVNTEEESKVDGMKEYHVVADEEWLPLKSDSVDLAVSSMSMHWVNELPDVLAQVNRVLKPNGVFLCAMLGGETLQELRSAFACADMERDGGVRPHVSPFAKLNDCGDLLSAAGFQATTIDSDVLEIPYPDAFTLMHALECMRPGSGS